ncbi:MAG: DUF3737 family protein, partial [Clostridia bacterium]|nr:DUF3737 family protein [Clostridia bacterium]
MKEIVNKNFPNERDLYGADGVRLINCTFDGVEDGESALKEGRNIQLDSCFMNLRYPLWHDDGVELNDVTMTDKCRAALWYSTAIKINDSKLHGIKALRECADINISNCDIVSPEFGWKSSDINVNNSSIVSEYAFLLSKDIVLENLNFKGKYSFQYVENMTIKNSTLDTKDAFWHTKNVTVENSIVKGEYLAWYSENLTLKNCKIIGTQPLCYCKGLKLINCTMEGTDFSFEYSDVDATVQGDILSVKNPRSGRIVADSITE